MLSVQDFWFESTLFKVRPGEDQETNPGVYGEALAQWVAAKFSELGYEEVDAIAEDFGWAVVIQGDVFKSGSCWIRCVGAPEDDTHTLWNVSVEMDKPMPSLKFWERGPKIAALELVAAKVNQQLEQILNSEPGIKLTEPPYDED